MNEGDEKKSVNEKDNNKKIYIESEREKMWLKRFIIFKSRPLDYK